jgi:cell division septation protein DedD
MEPKTTQKMIGFLIIAAIVIMVLPPIFKLKHSAKKHAMEASAAEQTNSDTSDAAKVASNPATVETTTTDQTIPVVSQETTTTTEATTTDPVVTSSVATEMNKDDTIPATTTSSNVTVDNNANVTPLATPTTEQSVPLASATAPDEQQEISLNNTHNNLSLTNSTPEPKKAVKSLAKSHAQTSTQKSWAIQLGHFKNKENVTKLTQRLNAAGFKTFTRAGKSGTSVYVGPESKQASAAKLSSQISQQFKIQGMVISYSAS